MTSANHLLALINEVLDLARIEAGHIRLEPEAVEPAEIAAECVRARCSRRLPSTGCGSTSTRTPIGSAMLDPGRLRQVILNFLSNALKFTGAGGTVSAHVGPDRRRIVLIRGRATPVPGSRPRTRSGCSRSSYSWPGGSEAEPAWVWP